MATGLGKRIMKRHTRIIFWLLLLFVGMQWIGDPVEVRLTGEESQAAGWHDPDDNGPDNSHHYGLTLLAHFSLEPAEMPMATTAASGWLWLSLDASTLQDPSHLHRIPRAPPTA